MEIISYVESNCFALAILALIYANTRRRPDRHLYEQRLFTALLLSNAVMLALDSVQWMLNGVPGEAARTVNTVLTAVYYSNNPVPCVIWILYANFQVYRDEKRARRLLFPLLLPVAANCALAVVSCFWGYAFYFDDGNVYHRGKLFFILAVICFSMLAFSQVFIFRNQALIERRYFFPIAVFSVPPFVGCLLQSIFYGLSVVWVCMSFSILIIFINIQNDQLFTDHLTGLYNRRQLDFSLQEMIRSGEGSIKIAGIMIDIDSFKKINDIYGHSTGDRALMDAGRILSSSFRREDLVCRYGGDEFVVILKILEDSDLARAVGRIRENVRRYSERAEVPFALSFSIGSDIYDYDSGLSAQQFLRHIDSLMYADKKGGKIEPADR